MQFQYIFRIFQNTTWNSSFQRTCVALNMSDRYLDYDFTHYENQRNILKFHYICLIYLDKIKKENNLWQFFFTLIMFVKVFFINGNKTKKPQTFIQKLEKKVLSI